MKKWKRILSAALSVLLLSGSISVCAAERTYTDRSEVIGTAVVVGDEDSAGGSSLFPDREQSQQLPRGRIILMAVGERVNLM